MIDLMQFKKQTATSLNIKYRNKSSLKDPLKTQVLKYRL